MKARIALLVVLSLFAVSCYTQLAPTLAHVTALRERLPQGPAGNLSLD